MNLDPDYPQALFYLGEIAFANSDYTKAVELFKQALEKDSMLPGPSYRLGQYALMTGDTKLARNYLVTEMELAG